MLYSTCSIDLLSPFVGRGCTAPVQREAERHLAERDVTAAATVSAKRSTTGMTSVYENRRAAGPVLARMETQVKIDLAALAHVGKLQREAPSTIMSVAAWSSTQFAKS